MQENIRGTFGGHEGGTGNIRYYLKPRPGCGIPWVAPDHAGRDQPPARNIAMTIAELITALAAYDPNLQVIVRSYESGYDHVRVLGTVKVAAVPNPAWYDGELNKIWDDDAPASPVDFVALHLGCGNRG